MLFFVPYLLATVLAGRWLLNTSAPRASRVTRGSGIGPALLNRRSRGLALTLATGEQSEVVLIKDSEKPTSTDVEGNMSELPPGNADASGHPLMDPRYFSEHFLPGRWLDRRQKVLSTYSVLSGCYERSNPVTGKWYSSNLHYFDMCLAQRPASTRVRFEGDFRNSAPMGEIFFVPAGSRYVAEGGVGQQRNMFVFLDARNLGD